MNEYISPMDKVLADLGTVVYLTAPLENGDWDYYDIFIARAADGYYLSTDSGCSCYSPFESIDRADVIGPLTLDQVLEEFESLRTKDGTGYYNDYRVLSEENVADIVARIKGL